MILRREPGDRPWSSYVADRPAGIPGQALGLGPLADPHAQDSEAIWERFYVEAAGGDRIESLRDEWLDFYDLVLVDSTPGTKHASTAAIVQLADVIVACVGMDADHVNRTQAVLEQAQRLRRDFDFDRPPVTIIPVAIDPASGVELSDDNPIAHFCDSWLPRSKSAVRVLQALAVTSAGGAGTDGLSVAQAERHELQSVAGIIGDVRYGIHEWSRSAAARALDGVLRGGDLSLAELANRAGRRSGAAVSPTPHKLGQVTGQAARREANPMGREHFIPFRRADIVSMCTSELPKYERRDFETFCRLLVGLLHHQFQARIDELKDAFACLDVNADTRYLREPTECERHDARIRVEQGLIELATKANFTQVDMAELERAYGQDTLLKIRVSADLDAVEKLLLFRRGESTRTETVKTWFGFRRKEVTFANYARVLVYATFKGADHFDAKKLARLPFKPGSTVIKMFQNIPAADLEMVLPNLRVQMRPADRLLIGVPALVTGIVVLAKAWLPILLLLTLLGFWLGLANEPQELTRAQWFGMLAGLGALGGYFVRQLNKFKNRKILFMKSLSDNLYFRNLDNDAGVFHHLLDAAEEAEVKEAVLAYHFLRTADTPLNSAELDQRIEQWFRQHGCEEVDFDVDDGLAKLRAFGLVDQDSSGRLRPIPLPDAKRKLDRMWDDVFVCDAPPPAACALPPAPEQRTDTADAAPSVTA